MSNSTQNDHETHTACIGRIKKEGASSTCCYCNPHEGCTIGINPYPGKFIPVDRLPEASKTKDRALGEDWNSFISPMVDKDGCIQMTPKGVYDWWKVKLADARKEVIRRIEAMPDKDVRPEITVWLESKEYCLGYNEALKNVLATLREEEGT